MIPKKLKYGDEVRVVSPATSLSIVSNYNQLLATENLSKLGLNITFSKNASVSNEFTSSSIKQRVDDLHEAFLDKKVKAIISSIGGFNSNQILNYIDYSIIKENPKIFCGYSDITALGNAIYARTGLVTYSGPAYSTFGMKKGLEYTNEYFEKCLMKDEEISIVPSSRWSDDEWYIEQEKRRFVKNEGFKTINEGMATGTLVGGNLSTINLLQGTKFMPSLKNTIVFLEDDYASTPSIFDRQLQSLLHQSDFDEVKGLLIGRFQTESGMTEKKLLQILKSKKEFNSMIEP